MSKLPWVASGSDTDPCCCQKCECPEDVPDLITFSGPWGESVVVVSKIEGECQWEGAAGSISIFMETYFCADNNQCLWVAYVSDSEFDILNAPFGRPFEEGITGGNYTACPCDLSAPANHWFACTDETNLFAE